MVMRMVLILLGGGSVGVREVFIFGTVRFVYFSVRWFTGNVINHPPYQPF